MGAINGTAMVTQGRAILGAISTDLISDAIGLALCNAAMVADIAARVDLDELDEIETKASGTSGTLDWSTTNALLIKGIVNASGTPMRHVTSAEFDRLTARVAAAGSPLYWIRTGDTDSGAVRIKFYPIPAAGENLTMNYKTRPAAMTTGATTIDTIYDEPLIYYTASRMAAYLRMYDDSAKLRQYADTLFESALGTQKTVIPMRGNPKKEPRILTYPPALKDGA